MEENKEKKRVKTVAAHINSAGRNISVGIIFIISLVLSIGSLTTISSRQSTLSDLQKQLSELQANLSAVFILSLDLTDFDPRMQSKQTLEEQVLTTGDKQISYENLDTQINNAKQNTQIGNPKNDTQITNPIIDMESLGRQYQQLNIEISTIKKEITYGKSTAEISMKTDSLNAEEESKPSLSVKKTTLNITSLENFSSDTLLGVLLVFCGIIGSIMSSLREERNAGVKVIILGGSVGFVAMLAVKGGSTVFILESSGYSVPLNAYSIAFVGIISGLFSEKFYHVLSSMTDRLLQKSQTEANKANSADAKKRRGG